MSIDESSINDDKYVTISHPLPWLSLNVTLFKKKSDETSLKDKRPKARRQMKERVEGCPLRPQPDGVFPSWVFKN